MASGCVAASKDRVRPPDQAKYGGGVSQGGKGGPQVDLGPRGGEGPVVEIPGRPSIGGDAQGGAAGGSVTEAGVNDNARLGTNTRLYLSAQVPKVVIEVDALAGYEPTTSALTTLRSRLDSVSDKPGGVELLPVETFSDDRSPWTEADIYEVEKRNRDRYSTANEMVLYVLYLNGAYADGEETLGLSYKASAFAIFVERIREAAATPLVPADSIERAVAVHEMGHVLALVNIGYRSPRDHEDPQHKGHSGNPDSVMYWAVDNVGVANLLGGRTMPPTNFDADDRADLEDLKTGRLRVE